MTEIVFYDGAGKARIVEERPLSLVLKRDGDTPADALELVFSGQVTDEAPSAVRVVTEKGLLFSGITDEYVLETTSAGQRSFFSFRSTAALLIDNEAEPGTLRAPSLRLLEARFTRPLGIETEGGDFAMKPGVLVLEKGTSVWAVLCRFGALFLHTQPHMTRAGAVSFSERAAREIRLTALLGAEVCHRPYACISRVTVQNSRSGAYSAVFQNARAGAVQRARFLEATAEKSPREIIEGGERARHLLRLTCRGLVDAEPGDFCALGRFGAPFAHARLQSLLYTVKESAAQTELTFSPGEEDVNAVF